MPSGQCLTVVTELSLSCTVWLSGNSVYLATPPAAVPFNVTQVPGNFKESQAEDQEIILIGKHCRTGLPHNQKPQSLAGRTGPTAVIVAPLEAMTEPPSSTFLLFLCTYITLLIFKSFFLHFFFLLVHLLLKFLFFSRFHTCIR